MTNKTSALHQNVWLISVPAGRFVAAATLALRFRTEQSFLGASDEPLHSRCSLQGLICDADPQGVAQPPLQSTYIQGIRLTNASTTFGDEPKQVNFSILCMLNQRAFIRPKIID